MTDLKQLSEERFEINEKIYSGQIPQEFLIHSVLLSKHQ